MATEAEVFRTWADTGSYAAAGRRHGVTPAAVKRIIANQAKSFTHLVTSYTPAPLRKTPSGASSLHPARLFCFPCAAAIPLPPRPKRSDTKTLSQVFVLLG